MDKCSSIDYLLDYAGKQSENRPIIFSYFDFPDGYEPEDGVICFRYEDFNEKYVN